MSSVPSKPEPLHVPMPDIVQFVRQLSHDLRNHLNAAELQSAYLKEVAENAEMKDEVARLRAMLGDMGSSLQRLTSLLATPKLSSMLYETKAFVEDLQAKVRSQFPEQETALQWQVEVGASEFEVDPQLLQQSLLELFANAFLHGRAQGEICVRAEEKNGEFRFSLHEPKEDFASETADWGRAPFRKVKHGHYGLGLLRVRHIIEAHHGRYDAQYDPASSTLVTTIALPLAAAA